MPNQLRQGLQYHLVDHVPFEVRRWHFRNSSRSLDSDDGWEVAAREEKADSEDAGRLEKADWEDVDFPVGADSKGWAQQEVIYLHHVYAH